MTLSQQNSNTFLVLVLVLFSFSLGCKKDSDDTPPIIHVDELNEYYNIWDEVQLVCNISDNNTLDYVTVQLLDARNYAIVNSIVIRPEDKVLDRTLQLSINNPHIQSGDYEIKIKASDGIHTSEWATSINIIEIPLSVDKTIILNNDDINTHAQEFNYQGELQDKLTIAGIYNNSFGSTRNHEFYVSTNNNGYRSTRVFAIENYSWVNSSPRWLDDDIFDKSQNRYYGIQSENWLVSFDSRFGNLSLECHGCNWGLSTGPSSPISMKKLTTTESYIWAATTTLSWIKNIHRISKFTTEVTGTPISLSLDSEVKFMFSGNDNEVIVIGKVDNGAFCGIIENESTTIQLNPLSIDSEEMNEGIITKENCVIIAHETKIMKYDFESNTSQLLINQSADCMAYDAVNNRLIFGSGNEITSLDLASLVTTPLSISAHQVEAIHVFYNRMVFPTD